MNRHPKEEPYKRYTYTKNGHSGPLPYTTEMPTPPGFKVRAERVQEDLQFSIMEAAMRSLRTLKRGKGDHQVDDFLVDLVHSRGFGFGF